MPRIGHSRSPAQDPVRFAQSPVAGLCPLHPRGRRSTRTRPARPCFTRRHFGLFGPNGPLPLCLTEYARDRILHHGDPTFAAFCNVFHHRLISFFFRAWADAQKAVDFDRPERPALVAVRRQPGRPGHGSLRDRDSVPDRAKLYFAGRLVQQTRNAEGLEAIIQDFFGVRTEVQTFVGRWLNLPAGSRLPAGRIPGDRHARAPPPSSAPASGPASCISASAWGR